MHDASPKRRTLRWTAARLAALSSLVSALVLGVALTHASSQSPPIEGGDAAENAAVALIEEHRFIRARDAATAILRRNNRSFIAHFVLAAVHHEAEANFPVGLHHANEAARLYGARYGNPPRPGSPWMWHARILIAQAELEGEVGDHEARLATLDRFNSMYQPKRVAERAWSLMKLRRFDEARRVALEGISTGEPNQVAFGYNALCAIEFEAGVAGNGYEACSRALELGRLQPGGPQVVDLTNFAESARTELLLEESERVLLEATELSVTGYGNPWLELGELYLREARFAESLSALRNVPDYRMQRPPAMRESDRNESRRVIAELFLLLGRPEEAVRITDRAVVAPDRRSHNSRDPEQDRAIVALVDRAARLDLAEVTIERAVAKPYHARMAARLRAMLLRFEAWQSGRRVAQLLSDGGRLAGLFAIGTAKGGITPPWLVGDIVDILGPGPVRAAIAEARRADRRPRSPGYYDAFDAEACAAGGDDAEARRLAQSAITKLPQAEAVLIVRMRAILATLALDAGGAPGAVLSPIFERDPSLLRRRRIVVPVRIGARGALGDEVRDALARSPRFDETSSDIAISIVASTSTARICLAGARGESFGCGEATARSGENARSFVQRAVDEFHRVAFSPRVNLSQTDIASLDGSTRGTRDPLRGLRDIEEP
jgi:tetratricopeptide (TPR) repeat protein